jgi:hypothetical protein
LLRGGVKNPPLKRTPAQTQHSGLRGKRSRSGASKLSAQSSRKRGLRSLRRRRPASRTKTKTPERVFFCFGIRCCKKRSVLRLILFCPACLCPKPEKQLFFLQPPQADSFSHPLSVCLIDTSSAFPIPNEGFRNIINNLLTFSEYSVKLRFQQRPALKC